MAIEVLERGSPPSEKVYETHCNGCHSKLRFKRSDAQFTSDQRDGDFLSIACPVCGRNVYTAA